jgi:hypothetical protein
MGRANQFSAEEIRKLRKDPATILLQDLIADDISKYKRRSKKKTFKLSSEIEYAEEACPFCMSEVIVTEERKKVCSNPDCHYREGKLSSEQIMQIIHNKMKHKDKQDDLQVND